jgi:transcriptional regulator with XRE-family HTH domain
MRSKKDPESEVLRQVGKLIKRYRKDLVDIKPYTREGFILAASDLGLPSSWLSEKSLANIENGLNMPSLYTLYLLSLALQIDANTLFSEVAEIFVGSAAES